MTVITNRSAPFEALGDDFIEAFGNVDVTPVVDGAAQPVVRGILRQSRDIDLVEQAGIGIEGVVHTLSLRAGDAEHLQSGRDSVRINGTDHPVAALRDDGRAMIQLYLRGDI